MPAEWVTARHRYSVSIPLNHNNIPPPGPGLRVPLLRRNFWLVRKLLRLPVLLALLLQLYCPCLSRPPPGDLGSGEPMPLEFRQDRRRNPNPRALDAVRLGDGRDGVDEQEGGSGFASQLVGKAKNRCALVRDSLQREGFASRQIGNDFPERCLLLSA